MTVPKLYRTCGQTILPDIMFVKEMVIKYVQTTFMFSLVLKVS